jgi:hypothetical protein
VRMISRLPGTTTPRPRRHDTTQDEPVADIRPLIPRQSRHSRLSGEFPADGPHERPQRNPDAAGGS